MGILFSVQCCVGGGKDHMPSHLCIAPCITGKAEVASIDGFGIPAKKVVRHAEICGRVAIGSIKVERTLQPLQCLPGATRPHQYGSPLDIVVGIARIEPECAVDLRQCEIVALPEKMDRDRKSVV